MFFIIFLSLIRQQQASVQSKRQNNYIYLQFSFNLQSQLMSQQQINQGMDQSQRFSFGAVEDTIYVSFQELDTEVKLPYNPFIFDLKLSIYKSKQNYEQPGIQYPLSKSKKLIFCRKKKVQKQWPDQNSAPIYLSAEIISEKHFSINENYELVDENSKHGTYFWINKQNPLKIQINDIFLIAKQPLQITNIQKYPTNTLQFKFQGNIYNLSQNKKLFLIGSNKICDIIVPYLYEFEVCINLSNFTIFTYLDEEECLAEHGVWFKLRNDKQKSLKLEHGNLILVEPYIFRVSS